MQVLKRVLLVLAVVALMATVASAGPIAGSLPLAGFIVTQDGANLAVSTLISSVTAPTSGFGVGDFAAVLPVGSDFGPTLLDLTAGTFSLSNAVYGTFVSSAMTIVTQNASFLDVYFLGTYTPGSGIPGVDPGPASARVSINQSGESLSEAITLNAPPAGIPEPATMALMGGGLVGIAFLLRRKRA